MIRERIDMNGKIFGKWTVLKYAHKGRWLCKCDCGVEANVLGHALRIGQSTQCLKCYARQFGHAEINIGDKLNNWTVIEQVKNRGYRCRCKCGSEQVIWRSSLIRGRSKGCKNCDSWKRILPENRASIVQLKNAYKTNAIARKLSFELSYDEFKVLYNGDCFYCGKKAIEMPRCSHTSKGAKSPFYYNGIDRKDNTLGYITSNVVSCCACCNRAKHNLTFPLFQIWLNRIKTTIDVKQELV